MNVRDKVIWITGASSGIGKELALQLAAGKNKLVLSARNQEALEEVSLECQKSGSETLVLPLDLMQMASFGDAVQTVLNRFGKIDILINNGGRSQRGTVLETSDEVERSLMDLNFFGPVMLTKSVLPYMVRNKSGNIVVISSMSGLFGWGMRSTYAASKHALKGYFESLAIEHYKDGIHVNVIYPGRINTPISENAVRGNGERYGNKDAGQENGISTKDCVRRIILAIEKNKPFVIIAGMERLMYFIWRWSKRLYVKIGSNRDWNA